jgi:acyl CoA:acetate/3-ketoacid CoA transferase beta subunit
MSRFEWTVDELICTCIARQIQDGDVLAQGLATPLVAAGYLLAWHTHAPHVYFASAIGQTVCREGAPLGIASVESLWLDRAMTSFGFVQAAADLLPSVKPKEFFRPGQVDANGNFNNIAIGKDYRKPRLRLPGTGGIPDVTTYMPMTYLYVPRHSRVTFVSELDHLSGLGHHKDRTEGGGPVYLVSDLGQFDYPEGRMRLKSIHPGVSLDRIRAKTGFKIEVPSDVVETQPPSTSELELLRTKIDPLGIRKLEMLSGYQRRTALRDALALENVFA